MAVVERLRESLSWLQEIQQTYHYPQQNNVIYDNSIELYRKPMFDCRENNDFESLILHKIDNVGFSSTEISTSPPMDAKESSRKRKTAVVFDATEDYCKTEKSKEDPDEKSNKRSSRTSSTSKDSEVQKPDYIHVRARRGQATDNHSLAERARREKIGKKMKCLQDLVPGCDKISGKAGMLDEIINYVQSLQTQVEFLSMRIAALNPRPDFINGSLCAKEFLAYTDNFPAADMSSPEMGNLGTMQFNAMLQQGLQSCVFDMPMTQKNTRAIMTLPQTQPFPSWDIDWQSLYNVELQ